jgi:hypothetical protein
VEIVSVNVIVSGDVHRPGIGKKAPAALHVNNSLPQKYLVPAADEEFRTKTRIRHS